MTINAYKNAYNCLLQVYGNKSYSGIELNSVLNSSDSADKPLITKLVYGVLDNDIKCEYILKQFATGVKSSQKILLKMGIYSLLDLSMGAHTIINVVVELAKKLGKDGASGFINATLRAINTAITNNTIKYPVDELENLSIKFSLPVWMVSMLLSQYSTTHAMQILSYKPDHKYSHIRVNPLYSDNFTQTVKTNNIQLRNSILSNCYYIVSSDLSNIDSKYYTIQSLGSCLVCEAATITDGMKVLDVCAAPGGKAINMAQKGNNITVTACDYLPHRVNLIKSYASRMNVSRQSLEIVLNDACGKVEKWKDNFDVVLADVPCSGLGVMYSKPDIKLFRTETDLVSLVSLQQQILQTSSNYVKIGGTLIYSTCTVLMQENDNIVNSFLQSNKNFALQRIKIPVSSAKDNNGMVQLLPNDEINEGFFIARFIRLS